MPCHHALLSCSSDGRGGCLQARHLFPLLQPRLFTLYPSEQLASHDTLNASSFHLLFRQQEVDLSLPSGEQAVAMQFSEAQRTLIVWCEALPAHFVCVCVCVRVSLSLALCVCVCVSLSLSVAFPLCRSGGMLCLCGAAANSLRVCFQAHWWSAHDCADIP